MKRVEVTLHTNFYPVNELRDFIAGVCRTLGLSKKDAMHVKAAVDEACSNIITHAYKNKKGNIKSSVIMKILNINKYYQYSGGGDRFFLIWQIYFF